MNIERLSKRIFSFWYLNGAAWLTLTLIYLILYYRDNLSDINTLLGLSLTYIAAFLVTIFLRYFYKWLREKESGLGLTVVLVFITSIVAANFWYWLDFMISIPLHGYDELAGRITLNRYLSSIFSNSFVIFTWSVAYFAVKLWVEWSIQKERSDEAAALAQKAQLEMLRYQLNPHFLFNSLNSIRALIDYDNKTAKLIVSELSEFLRYSLLSRDLSEVTLSKELDAIKHYLTIEKIRFEEKLDIKYEIDRDALDYPILSFLLHPLVENAVKYGMQTSRMPLVIRITGKVFDGALSVKIINSGKWVEGGENNGTGTGIENVKKRLVNAYPKRYKFSITENANQVSVEISIRREVSE